MSMTESAPRSISTHEAATACSSSWSGNARGWIVAAWGVVLLSCLINLQGWQHHWQMMDDRVINIDEANRFVTEGRFPQIGGFASTGGFNPPGLSYLLSVGLLSGNFLLVETLGATLFHLLTLLGIWRLTCYLADRRTAVLAMLFYSVSLIGISFGSWLWPRAMPACTVWWMYYTVKWVSQKSSWALFGALAWYAFGCYVFLEFLPACVAFPVVWYIKRPPVRWLACVAAALFAGMLWYPYLAIQFQNNFADVRMQLFDKIQIDEVKILSRYQASLETYDKQTGKYDPDFRPIIHEELSGSQNRLKKIFFRFFYFIDNLGGLFTYPAQRWGLIAFALFLLPIMAWLWAKLEPVYRSYAACWVRPLGWLVVIAAIIINPWTAAFLLKRELENQELLKVLALEGVVMILGVLLVKHRWLEQALTWLREKLLPLDLPGEQPAATDTLLIAFIPVWIVMAMLSIMTRYFMWLWSVQVIILALGTCYWPLKQAWPRWLPCGMTLVALLAIGWNNTMLTRLNGWRNEGFHGQPHSMVLALDEIAAISAAQQQSQIRVGYHLWFVGYELLFCDFEERYKLGSPFDQYFAIQHKLENLNKNDLGIAPDDQFRIVNTQPIKSQRYRVKFADAENFELYRNYPGIELWRRKSSQK